MPLSGRKPEADVNPRGSSTGLFKYVAKGSLSADVRDLTQEQRTNNLPLYKFFYVQQAPPSNQKAEHVKRSTMPDYPYTWPLASYVPVMYHLHTIHDTMNS